MEAVVTERGESGKWPARPNWTRNSTSDEDMQAVLNFIANIDGPLPLGSSQRSLRSSVQAGDSFTNATVLSAWKYRKEMLEKFFLTEVSNGAGVLKASSEGESRLSVKSGQPGEVCNTFQAAGRLLPQNQAQSVGTDLDAGTVDMGKNEYTMPRATEVSNQMSCSEIAPSRRVECSAEQLVRRCSTVHNDPVSTPEEEGMTQLTDCRKLSVEGQVVQDDVESLQEASEDRGAEGCEVHQRLSPVASPAAVEAKNLGNGSGGRQMSSELHIKQQHMSQVLHREPEYVLDRELQSLRDRFNQEISREESCNQPVVRLKQKVLRSSQDEWNEPHPSSYLSWLGSMKDKVQQTEASERPYSRPEGFCREDRYRRPATTLKVHDLTQTEVSAARARGEGDNRHFKTPVTVTVAKQRAEGRSSKNYDDRRKSSTGSLKLMEDRTRKLSWSSSSQQAPENISRQDSYPLFVMVDQPTHVSDVPFMDKRQLDRLPTLHSARHGHSSAPLVFSSQTENSEIEQTEIEIVEAASERTCTLNDLLSLPRPSTQVVTLRQVLRNPEGWVANGKSIQPVVSKAKRRSHNKPPLDTACYCYVPNYTGRLIRKPPDSKRTSQKQKHQLGQILGRQNSSKSRTVESRSSTSLPSSGVPSSVGRYSFADREGKDYYSQTTSHSERTSCDTEGRHREQTVALGSQGETRLHENASLWKSSPPTNSGRKGPTVMRERMFPEFHRILSAVQASRAPQGMHMTDGKELEMQYYHGSRCGDKESSVGITGRVACEALDFNMDTSSSRRQSFSHSSFTRSNSCSHPPVREPLPSLPGADCISQTAEEHSVSISPSLYAKLKEEGPEETVTHRLQTCSTLGPHYWSSRHSLDPNYRIQDVEMFLQEHQDSCTCGHHHSSCKVPSDKEVLTRPDVPHERRRFSSSHDLDVGKWSHYTDVGFFEGIVELAVTSLRHFCACLINCRDDFINYGSHAVTALLHDLLPEANFARPQDRHIGIQACLNDAIFGHFNEEAYGLEAESYGFPSPRFRKEFFLEKFHRLSSLFPEQGICMPHKQVQSGELQDFHQFCRSKLSTIQERMGLKIEAWPRLLLHTFFEAMKQVLRVHKLAFSMEPPATMLYISKGADFNLQYMELIDMNSMIGHFVSSATANWNFVPHVTRTNSQTPSMPGCRIPGEFDSKVEFMVTPGFELKNRIIKSQVYLQPKIY